MSARKIIIGCVTDRQPKYLDEAVRLLTSLRWFGGALKDAPFIVCAVDGMPADYEAALIKLGATIRSAERFDSRHGPSNKLRFLEMAEPAQYDLVMLLDCDTLVLQDPSPYLPEDGFAAKLADLPTVTPEEFRRIFARCGFADYPPDYRADVNGALMQPYFNAGVCIFTRKIFKRLSEAWITWDRQLLDLAKELQFPLFHADQASLTLALLETATPVTLLPTQMNLPAHLQKHQYPNHFQEIEPVILHYHSLVREGGEISELPLAAANRWAANFNLRWRKEHA